MAELKPADGKVPRFILGFRMYPNAQSKYWDQASKEHVCGCGCWGGNGNYKSRPALKRASKKRGPARARRK